MNFECRSTNSYDASQHDLTTPPQATNTIGPGKWSLPVTGTTQITLPGPPGKPRNAGITIKSITMAWAEPVSGPGLLHFGGLPLQEYRIYTNFMANVVVEKTDLTQIELPGLEAGTPYYFEVQACTSRGCGPKSPRSDWVTTLVGKPDAPKAPAIEGNVTSDSVTLSWFAPSHNGRSITKYAVRYKKQSNGTWVEASNDVKSLSFKVLGLDPNTPYEFQVQVALSAMP